MSEGNIQKGRTKGAKGLPPRKKAQILADKNTALATQAEIAIKHGVSESTVSKVDASTLPPEVIEMAKEYERDYLAYAQATAMKAMRNTFEKVDDLTADKSIIVAEKSFNMSQLITNKPTELVLVQEQYAREFFQVMLKAMKYDLAIEAVHHAFPDVDVKLLTDGGNESE